MPSARVSFDLARSAFGGAFAIEREDATEDYGEPRYNLLGMANGRLLFRRLRHERRDRPRHLCERGGTL
jgi:uncharacterized DUF497 family protein